ncbi:DNA-binding protein [Paraburkholderia hospita]|uniref:DNA-binding protein n=1 Tax=Paraburkholderia hospita TaxID=169430 RepID=A0ABN0FP04_9BURK|nr:helix-turn-helix transcriptional regulator [Paraburkholderia hospita]EIN00400.1 DNA-binding protein [Paraburkholderia hospita]OUL88412.1 transcriptional regulator [Paraburkholderia hospita]
MDETTTTPRQRAARLRLATNLKVLRGKMGVSQEELAKLAGIHRNHMGQIERGRVGVTIDNLASLAEALGVDEVLLLSEPTEVPTPLKMGRKKKAEAADQKPMAKTESKT